MKIFGVILTVLCFGSELCHSLKILGVYTLTSRSHMNVFGSLMKGLALKGHQVDVVSLFPLKKPVANYTDIVIESNMDTFKPNQVTYEDVLSWRNWDISELVTLCGDDPCSLISDPSFQKVLNSKKGTYDVIVLEIFMTNCYIPIGKHLDAPLVALVAMKLPSWFWKPFGSEFNSAYMPTMFSSVNQYMGFWERLHNTYLRDSIELQITYHLESQVDVVEKHFGRKLNSISELYKEIDLMLVNSHHSLDANNPTTPDIIDVAGLHVEDDTQVLTPDIKKWLDESTDGCVYFTFGSMVSFDALPEKIQENFYKMFRRIAPVRVLMKVGNASQLIPGLPKNVKYGSWLPQIPILKHKNVKVFITHGGLMSTQEAIAYRVPLVGIPLFADQFMNMKSYAKKGIAVVVEFDEKTLTADALTDAVKSVLYDPSYRQNIEKLSDIFMDRPMSALDTAVYWVEYAARHGRVLKSPAIKLSWWQLKLLDVYGFMLICALLVMYLTWKITTLLWRFIRFCIGSDKINEPKLVKRD